MVIGLDTESFYSGEFSTKTLGAKRYASDPRAEHYLVSMWCPEWHYVGHPSEAPWERLQGQTLVIHNPAYDLLILEVVAPPLELEAVYDTAALAAYLQCNRNLKDAAKELLGVTVDKSVRDRMKGKHFHKLTPEQQDEVRRYALADPEHCYHLWDRWNHLWPEHERELSWHTVQLSLRGIGIDSEMVEGGIKSLRRIQEEKELLLPWIANGEPPTSPKAMALECRRLGIEPPASTAKDSEEFEEWATKYADQVPMVKAMQEWRSINRTIEVLRAMEYRTFGDTLYYDLMYGGAPHTMRWAGSSGLNMQNLSKTPVFGVDVRKTLVPRGSGNKLIVADYSQIEARVLLWLAGDERMLETIRSGIDIYEAHARATMGYSKPEKMSVGDPSGRQLAKIRVLQLGYGSSWKKFQATYAKWNPGKSIDDQTAVANVKDFRRKNLKILELWRRMERSCRASKGGSFIVELPSGRKIEYFNIAEFEGELSGRVKRGGNRTKLYGGKLVENLCQATARDIMAMSILRLEAAGLKVVLTVHDEIVVEAPASAAEDVKRIMEQPPEWAEGCPIAVECKVCERYGK